MTPATKLVYDFERKFQSANVGSRRDIPLVDVIAYLNEAQAIWFQNMADLFEVNNKVRGDLQQFEIKKVKLPLVDGGDEYNTYKYPPDLYKRLNQIAKCTGLNLCKGQTKHIPIHIERSDKINEVLRNPFQNADFCWEQLNGDDAQNLLYVYHLGEMKIEDVFIDYLRVPQEIHAPSLNDCDGKYFNYAGEVISEDQDFEPKMRYAEYKVVDIAILLAERDRMDYNSFQSQIQAITFGDAAYKN